MKIFLLKQKKGQQKKHAYPIAIELVLELLLPLLRPAIDPISPRLIELVLRPEPSPDLRSDFSVEIRVLALLDLIVGHAKCFQLHRLVPASLGDEQKT